MGLPLTLILVYIYSILFSIFYSISISYPSHIHIYIKNHLPELICKSESNVSESIGDAGGNIEDNDISFS